MASLDKLSKIKIGLGVFMIGLTAYTINFIMKQVRLLTNTRFEMVGTSLNKLSLDEINITIWWKVTNLSDFTFTIKNQAYDIFINDTFIKKVGSAQSVEVLAKGTTRLPTYIVFTPKELIALGITNYKNLSTEEGRAKLKLKVKGDFTIGTSLFNVKKIPFEFKDSIKNIMNY